MDISIEQNKLCKDRQIIGIDKVLTLIGENGCGKSAILESIFKSHLEKEHANRIVCFSSGQNESYSLDYKNFLDKSRKLKVEGQINRLGIDVINSFYFDYNWSKPLIFFASSLKKDGFVRSLIKEKYIDINEFNVDVSSVLTLYLTIGEVYINKIKQALSNEAINPMEPNLRKTKFHSILSKIIESKIDKDFDFSDDLKRTKIELHAHEVLNIFDRDVNSIFTFLSVASNQNYFLNLKDTELSFKNNLKLNDLSDGEYQLLVVYSIIDLFDERNTLFLLDEIDSHLYYKNLERLWDKLKNDIKGKVITTTHISESILKNNYDDIRLVQKGKIEQDLTLRELAKRVSNVVGKENFEYELASRATNIVLVDDEDDWMIFKKLVEKKLGSATKEVLNKIIPFKRESNYNNASIHLGKSKLLFVQEFIKMYKDRTFTTKNFFLLCDKDKFSEDLISCDLEVHISDEFRYVKQCSSIKTFLLCWRRYEIENYLLGYTLLKEMGLLDEITSKLGNVSLNPGDNLDSVSEVRKLETKKILHPFYKPHPLGFNDELLDKLIKNFPAEEISDDISTMFKVLERNIN